MIMRKLKVLTVTLNVHRVRQFNQRNKTTNKSSNQQSPNNNDYMTQDEINEWNKNKPTTHDESQMGYGRGDYEALKKQVKK